MNRKHIVLENRNIRSEMAKTFKTKVRTVYNALHYVDNGSPMGNKLRAAAMQRGGIIVDFATGLQRDYTPDCNTSIDTVLGTMSFQFKNGCTLEWENKYNTVTIQYPSGNFTMTPEVKSISRLMELQRWLKA